MGGGESLTSRDGSERSDASQGKHFWNVKPLSAVFGVLTAVIVKSNILRVVTPRSLIEVRRRFGGKYYHHIQVLWRAQALCLLVAWCAFGRDDGGSSFLRKKLMEVYKTTRRQYNKMVLFACCSFKRWRISFVVSKVIFLWAGCPVFDIQ
jgi:hypothetical protein